VLKILFELLENTAVAAQFLRKKSQGKEISRKGRRAGLCMVFDTIIFGQTSAYCFNFAIVICVPLTSHISE